MSPDADVIVAGAGAMGSATTYALAARGARVIAIDRWAPPHAHGSTHGKSRIIREAYFEHPAYVPLVRRAYELWTALERETGARLFRQTGGLTMGPADGILVPGALESARRHDVAHEVLDAGGIGRRFPLLAPEPGTVGVYEERAGILAPERCISALREAARARGAVLRDGERVLRWATAGDGVRVTTDRGTTRAPQLVLALGAWLADLAPALGVRLRVERQVMHWFAPGPAAPADPEHLPVTLIEHDGGHMFYLIPDVGDGLKAAIHHDGPLVSPDNGMPVSDPERAPVRALVERFAPAAATDIVDSASCLYTNTDDGHFVIGPHPDAPGVIVVSACSGHGFKFAAAVGEAVAELALSGATSLDLSPFAPSRFVRAAGAPGV